MKSLLSCCCGPAIQHHPNHTAYFSWPVFFALMCRVVNGWFLGVTLSKQTSNCRLLLFVPRERLFSSHFRIVLSRHNGAISKCRDKKSPRTKPQGHPPPPLSACLPCLYPQLGCGLLWPQGTVAAQPVDTESGIAADCTKSEETGSPTMCHSVKSP